VRRGQLGSRGTRRDGTTAGEPPVGLIPSVPVAELLDVNAVAAIRTRGLSKDYGQGNGLFDLDLEIGRGEIFGFLGPNAQVSRRRCACYWT